MRKSVLGLAFAVLSPFMLWAQGIQFEEGSFSEALAKAKKENKIVFVDVYTTWCGPCKKMAKEFFPTKEAGDKYNTHFVNYKIDAEKGEGIGVAKKYKVEGYPTNLFIRPDGSIVYTKMGMSDLNAFLENADIALAEQKDPLKWEDYVVKLKKGNSDKTFITQYLQKAERLGKNSDEAINIYVAKYINQQKISDEDLNFLLDNTHTVDNKAFPILAAHADQVDALRKNIAPNFFTYYTQNLYNSTADKLGKNKEENRFEELMKPLIGKYSKLPESDLLFYKGKFYEAMGDEAKMNAFMKEKANYYTNKSDQAYDKENYIRKEETLLSIKQQMIANKVPEAQHQQQIDVTLEQNPSILSIASMSAASELNQIAWGIYEQEKKAQYKDALKWSKRSLELIGSDIKNRAAFIDTYAHLLFVDGQTEEAIKQQSEAVEGLKQAGITEGIEDFEQTLQSMKDGKL
ncbi:hypothetical protein DBR32_09560 [Taibaiella sp. KBW10]|uniref:thioredoxin family protein n=1 Tax=Taibaiella sp. KBW10 TaxID=2153357 RepID=UPI000F5AF7F2|nr:protein disulfide isomerase family protein [Taibaiella sp. KBW10]RQO30946.1 hypothetical protein DBR32_09560 [Taibaiella sp. KBW10]